MADTNGNLPLMLLIKPGLPTTQYQPVSKIFRVTPPTISRPSIGPPISSIVAQIKRYHLARDRALPVARYSDCYASA